MQKDLFPEKSNKKNNNVKKIGANLFLIFNPQIIRCQLLCPVGVNYLGRFFNLNKCFLSA